MHPVSPSTPRRASRAFTLIELLTVIAIIGILAAILIPTVGQVRRQAAAARSTSNLRQIGSAMLLYANDNKQSLPYAACEKRNPQGGWELNGSWDTFIGTYLGFQGNPDHPGVVTQTRVGALGLMSHPRDESIITNPTTFRRSYAMVNTTGGVSVSLFTSSGDQSARPYTINRIPAPGKTILAFEYPGMLDNFVGRTAHAGLNTPAKQILNQPDLNGNGKFQYLFVDGHVQMMDPKDTIGTGSMTAPKGMWTVADGD